MQTPFIVRKLLPAFSVVGLSFLLSACGNDDDSDSEVSTSSSISMSSMSSMDSSSSVSESSMSSMMASSSEESSSSEAALEPTIVDIVVEGENFTSLEAAVTAAGLVEALANRDATYTVFAPTDDAFAKFGDTLDSILADTEGLANILQYHVIDGAAVDAETAISLDGEMQTMLNGDDITLTVIEGSLYINNALVIDTDITTANGIIHVIDTVILPEPTIAEIAAADARFTLLNTALVTTGLDAALNSKTDTYTVFAPVDEAFEALGETLNTLLADSDALSDILLYHVLGDAFVESSTAISLAGSTQTTLNGDDIAITLDGESLFINDAEVVLTNVLAGNGVIHAIDKVILPPEPTQFDGTIADAAVATAELSTLVTALTTAGLVETLSDTDATFTVFAPTNAAFDKIPEADLTALLADTAELTDVLLFHVVSNASVDSITAISLDGTTVEMTNEADALIEYTDGMLYIEGALVETTDIQTDNGTVHLIDTVIFPPAE